jgi:hypothetical protein
VTATRLIVWVHPARSDRVFVDDTPIFDVASRPRPASGFGPPQTPGGQAVVVSEDRPPGTPTTIKTGDYLRIEILEGLPGRPLARTRVVRPDGSVSLGFYGDLKVGGLTRTEAKVKLIEHLRRHLTDEALGLVETDKDGKKAPVTPDRSTHVLVDDVLVNEAPDNRIDALEQKLDRILQLLPTLTHDELKNLMLDELQKSKKDRPR